MENVLCDCPVCSKGKLVRGSLGFACNYFKSMEDRCTFNIYHTYFGKVITDEIALDLIKNGKTQVFDDLKKKDGTLFSASIILEYGTIKLSFANRMLENKCPNCGRDIEILLSGYGCKGYLQENKECSFFIPKMICGKELPMQDVELLVQGQSTNFISGFKNREGNEFETRLLYKDGNVKFLNDLCSCPKCGGLLSIGLKAYNCSNYKNPEVKCDFVIWKEMLGRRITPEEAIFLCSKGETPILTGFRNKDGEMIDRKLIINEDNKIKAV